MLKVTAMTVFLVFVGSAWGVLGQLDGQALQDLRGNDTGDVTVASRNHNLFLRAAKQSADGWLIRHSLLERLTKRKV